MLLVLAFAPVYRLLDLSVEAPSRDVSVSVAEATLQLAWWGTVVTLLLAVALALLFPVDGPRAYAARAVSWLRRPPPAAYALATGTLATLIATVVAFGLYQGFLTNVDEMAYTLHARYLARGMLAGPTFSVPEFWLIPNTLIVAEGWVSHYPPTHLLAVAGMNVLGLPAMLGPLSFGLMIGLLTLALIRLLPESPGPARVAALVAAVCPLMLLLAGGSMNHVTAGALVVAALYAALRARDGNAWWAVLAGVAVGLAVADRPLTGLVLGSVFTLGVWIPAALRSPARGHGWTARRVLGTALGGAPVAVFLGWFNARLFGSPFTLGYLTAFGDRHRLGFHPDPWGSDYGVMDAVAFTSTDVLATGVQLLETTFPATALIGLALLTRMRLPEGTGVLLAWAFLPVVANGYYWFHNSRMLYEAAPAWVALFVLAAAYLTGGSTHAGPPAGNRRFAGLGRNTTSWAILIGVVAAIAWNIPARVSGYAWTEESLALMTVPPPPTAEPSIVFAHASWNERLSSRLQGAGGMRQDSIITALRRNTNCALHEYALAREALVRDGRDVQLPAVDLEQVSGSPPGLQRPPSPSGATLRVRQGERFTASCLRELRSDRFGAVALAPLIWQGDLPGIEEGRTMFVRDFGPERNQQLLDHYPARAAFVFTPTVVDGAPELLPYPEAMELLWGPQPTGGGS